MNTRRARTLRARAVLRARRQGFLTPRARWETFLPVYYGKPRKFLPSHIRLTPSDGGAAAVITADMSVTVLPRIREYPNCLRIIGAWVRVHVVAGEPLAAFDAVKELRAARAVRVEAWAAVLGLGSPAWAHLTIPDVHDTTWGPGNVEVTREGFTFELFGGHTDAEWRLAVRTDDPADTATEAAQSLAAQELTARELETAAV